MKALPRAKESPLDAYRAFCAPGAVEELEGLAAGLAGRTVLHVHSPGLGEDRARMLHRIGSIMGGLGVYPRWDVLVGTEEFFESIRTIREGLQGRADVISSRVLQAYQSCLSDTAARLYLGADFVIVHDFQAIGLVKWRRDDSKWIWRCHLDFSHATPSVWRFCLDYIRRYDATIVSHPKFTRKVPVPLATIAPSIDPLHERNQKLSAVETERILGRLGIPQDRPIVLVFLGERGGAKGASLLGAFQALERRVPLRLVVIGLASSGQEGGFDFKEHRRRVANRAHTHLLSLSSERHRELNALGCAAQVCIHPLDEEGLEVSVLEDLWRGKPVVVGRRVGHAIPIDHRKTGFVVRSIAESAMWTERILKDPELARREGVAAQDLVRERFLITRHVRDYLLLFRRLAETGR